MIPVERLFFFIAALLAIAGGIVTVGAKNPIRGVMGLLTTIVGIAGMYLLLSAELLAAVQILVYAGAVVVLFLFVIMLLGPSAISSPDAKSAVPRYLGAGVLVTFAGAMSYLLGRAAGAPTIFGRAPNSLGTIEGLGRELFSNALVPFELSGALLLIAVVGAVAIARGKQVDPTNLPQPVEPQKKAADPAHSGGAMHAAHAKEGAS